jgi:superoxide dismutase
MRVREKIHSGFFGRILRESNKTLKQLNLKGFQSLVIQLLSYPEKLTDPSTYVLHFSKRDSVTRTYIDTKEVLFTGKNLNDLHKKMSEEFSISDFTLVKHIPHAFEWKVLDPESSFTEKKKKTERTFKLGEL